MDTDEVQVRSAGTDDVEKEVRNDCIRPKTPAPMMRIESG